MQFEPQNPDYAEWIGAVFRSQRFMALLGTEMVHLEPGGCTLAIDRRGELDQHSGVVHGGVVGALADNAAGAAATSLLPKGQVTVTVEYKINFVSPAKGERLLARAKVLKPGRTLTVAESRVFARDDDVETLCAVALVTLTPVAVGG